MYSSFSFCVQDYHSLLFGSGRNVNSLATNVSSSLCLPISIQEVLDMNQALQTDTAAEVLVNLALYNCIIIIKNPCTVR